MTTTQHHHADPTTGHSQVADHPDPGQGRGDELEQRRQQRRLEQLLLRRERLARIADERESHDLPDFEDYRYELAVVEQAIGHCWPTYWEENFASWASSDGALMHSPDQPRADCGICSSHANSTPPPKVA
jgi:hypothetical protein